MSRKNWRNDLDLVVEENIRELIKETKPYDNEIRSAKNRGKAQIWVAMALLNQKINEIEVSKKVSTKKIPQKELDKILKTLENL